MLRKISLLGLMGCSVALLSGCPPPPAATTTGTGTPANSTSPGGSGSAGGTLKLGHFASLTGNTAVFGTSSDKGAQLAKDELNKSGGSVDIKTLDDASQQDQAAQAVNRLITEYGASAIIGEVASSRSIAAAGICDAQQVPQVSPASTNPDVTVNPSGNTVRPYVFRVCYTDPFQGAVIARFVKDNLKLTQAAILKDSKQAYSVGLARGFMDEFKKQGGTIVGEEAYGEGDSDFRGQLTKIKGLNAQVLIIPGYYREVGLIVKQARELGLNIPVMGGDGWDSHTLTEVGGQYFKDCYFSDHFSAEEKRPEVQEFVKAFRAKYNEEPDAMAALGYDAVKLVADASKRAGSTDRKALRDAIENTKDFAGVTGKITINKEHNAVKPAVVVRVETKDGKAYFPLVTTITP